MRKLLATALLLLFAVPSWAAITYNGVGTDSHANNGSTTPGLPTHASGDLLLIADTMRATAETPSATGYTNLYNLNSASTRITLFGKIDGGSESGPTVTVSGASNTHSSVMIGIDGTATDMGTVVHASASQANGGADNSVEYPALTITENNTIVVLILEYNNDDDLIGDLSWSTPSGFTQVGSYCTALGADMCTVVYYQIQTTATNISSGSVTRTTTGATASHGALIVSLKSSVVPPTFSVAPAIGTRTTSTIPVTATTACTDCTFYGVAQADGLATPTCTQIKAGQNGSGSAAYKSFSQAMTATVQGTGTFSTYTDGTIRDGAFCLNSTANGDSAVSTIADMYKTAAFSVTPSVTSQTTSAYTITKTLDGAGSCTAVACAKDATAPTVAQVLAGNCTGDAAAIATVTDASCEAGTMTLGGSLTRYVHDVYVAGTYGSQNSSLTTLADEMLDAATGREIINGATGYTSIHANSPIVSFNASATPDIVAGDIGQCDSTTSPGACVITYTATGLYSYPGSCGSTRQTFTCNFYDTSVGDLHADTMSVCVNNASPVATPITGTVVLTKDAAMANFDFATYFADADDATLTYTSSDTGTGTGANKRPAGTSIAAGVWSGTPTSATTSTGSFTITATDSCGDTDTVDVSWGVYEQVAVPDCSALPLSTCITALDAVNLDNSFTSQCSATVPVLTVISQDPAASTTVSQFSRVALVVSSGSCARAKNISLRFMP